MAARSDAETADTETTDTETGDTETAGTETAGTEPAQQSEGEPRPSAGSNLERHDPEYLDRDKLDFDPDDGLYSGTAVDGTSDIPGPHAEGTADDQE